MMSIFTSFIRKSSEALRSKTRNEQRLSRVTLNLGMFSEVMRNRFAKDTHLLHVESVLSLALLVITVGVNNAFPYRSRTTRVVR